MKRKYTDTEYITLRSANEWKIRQLWSEAEQCFYFSSPHGNWYRDVRDALDEL